MRIDRKTRIVMREHRAVALSINEFRLFDAIDQSDCKTLTIKHVRNALYDGSIDPPVWMKGAVNGLTFKLNRKLAHVGLNVRVINRGARTFYQLKAETYNLPAATMDAD